VFSESIIMHLKRQYDYTFILTLNTVNLQDMFCLTAAQMAVHSYINVQ